MNKKQKKQLLDMTADFIKSHDLLKRIKTTDQSKEFILILSNCQDDALQLGELIETLVGKDCLVIPGLEEYCELLYQISIGKVGGYHAYKIVKILNKQIHKIEKEIINTIKAKTEIVFFPYKASMWDSLESVWLAAQTDETCECHVIPIPFFDKNLQGEFVRRHYEIDEFPEYVPVKRYEDYKVEEQHPDIIFIHNPYDEGNYVTSVHPDYYACNLKKYTHMLVYIPYFISLGDVPKHFCVSAGTIYADKVIVQSDEVRNSYIREYNKFLTNHNLTGHLAAGKDKFIALGSPKIDKVLNAKEEIYELPKKWEKLIASEKDVSTDRKKIILYNTSVSAILQNRELVIDKLKYVFNIFSSRTDVVLWWRPHPLIIPTLEAMVPGLLNVYQSLIDRYCQEGFGIYDDSSDLTRAIAISDAYYGDWSSLVPLYKETGKPILIQEYVKTDNTNKFAGKLMVDQIIVTAGGAYFNSGLFNGIFHADFQRGILDYLKEFKDESRKGRWLYRNLILDGEVIYFIPCNSNLITSYNIKTKILEQYNVLPDDCNIDHKFSGGFIWKHKLYLFPGCYPAVICFDLVSKQCELFKEWFTDYLERLENIRFSPNYMGISRYGEACQYGDTIYLPLMHKDILLKLNLISNEIDLMKIDDMGKGYLGIHKYKDHYYLIPKTGTTITRWNEYSGIQKRFQEYTEIFDQSKDIMGKSIFWKHFIIIFPYKGNIVWILDLLTDNLRYFDNLVEKSIVENYSSVSYAGTDNVGNIMYFDANCRKFKALRVESGNESRIYACSEEINILTAKPEQVIEIMNHADMLPQDNISELSVDRWIPYVLHKSRDTKEMGTLFKKGEAGKRIKSYIMKQLI